MLNVSDEWMNEWTFDGLLGSLELEEIVKKDNGAKW
jgi:hypothetical protein